MSTIINTDVDGRTIIAISGRLDTTTVIDFEKEIASLIQMQKTDIVVECSDFDYVSSSGLRTFLSLQKFVTEKNGRLVLRNMKSGIRDVFEMTGLSNIFTIE